MAYEEYSLYKRYIEAQRDEYELAIIEIYEIINKLIDGIKVRNEILKISDNVRVEGRIKSFKSAFKNDLRDSKALDDCFGIRIIADNIKDASIIRQVIKRISNSRLRKLLGDAVSEDSVFKIIKEKNHAKRINTNYDAIHQIAIRNPKESSSPLIEIQYWDKKTEERCTCGDLNHSKYKHIQGRFEEIKNGRIGIEIPEYYEFDEEGNLFVLDKEQAILKMFPEMVDVERE